MSLVLEALKKLDREKGRAERGFVVMAATPWPARAVRRWPVWVAVLAIAAAAAAWIVMSRRASVTVTGGGASATAAAGATAAPDLTTVPAARVSPARRPAATRAPAADLAGPAASPRGAAIAPAPAPVEHGPQGLRLQAISQRDGQPVAIVNDRLVHVGDEFDGVRVLAIRESEVDVEVRGQHATLRF